MAMLHSFSNMENVTAVISGNLKALDLKIFIWNKHIPAFPTQISYHQVVCKRIDQDNNII